MFALKEKTVHLMSDSNRRIIALKENKTVPFLAEEIGALLHLKKKTVQFRTSYSILSHNLGRSSGHHR